METKQSAQTTASWTARFRSDQSGAIMLIGVFMAVCLAGMLWYLVGIGDTILYKQRMQDAADAVAYAAAVYHARGMNLVVMLNIIMAAILAVLVALKLLQVLNTVVWAVSCIISLIPGFGSFLIPVCNITTNLKQPIQNAIDMVQNVVDAVVPVLSDTQVAIAKLFPWLAEAKAIHVAVVDYENPVTFGAMLSPSLTWRDGRLGLPVEEDEFSTLCGKAAEDIGDIIFYPFPDGDAIDWVKKKFEDGIKAFGGYFCGSGAGELKDLFKITDEEKQEIRNGCNESKRTWENKTSDCMFEEIDGEQVPYALKPCTGIDYGYGYGYEPWDCMPYTSLSEDQKKKCTDNTAKCSECGNYFDVNGCIKQKQDKLEKDKADAFDETMEKAIEGDSTQTPKMIFKDAQNGQSYFQIWSFVLGDDTIPNKSDKGVALASWGKKDGSTTNAVWGRIAIAQAEFYYDGSGTFSSQQDPMWSMNWRARMRRLYSPAKAIEIATGVDVSGLLNSIQSIVDGLQGLIKSVGDVLNAVDEKKDGIKKLVNTILPGTLPETDVIDRMDRFVEKLDLEIIH